MRGWFAATTVGVVVLGCIGAAAVRNMDPGIALFTSLFQLPYLIPALIYYLRVARPAAVLRCGIVLVAVTTPPWVLQVFLVDDWRFASLLVVYAFLITLFSAWFWAGEESPRAQGGGT